MKGFLLVDKPSGMTSHDVVDCIRKAAGIRRVGHTGTLDPAATGLLIICLGSGTRLSEHLTGLDKVYEGDMRLGVVTDSYDMDGALLEEREAPEFSEDEIQKIFAEYTGDIEQVPPMVSAVKVGGERLYKKARKGETVEREPRPVTVHEFKVLGCDHPLIHFRVRCTRGTYVRALCHEVGQQLGCGGALDSLRRTAVGKHCIENATPLDSFETREDVLDHLLPLNEALDIPEVIVKDAGKRLVATGGRLHGNDLVSGCPVTEGWVQVKAPDGELLALAQVHNDPPEPFLAPRRVFMDTK